jgi:threonine/homoserine efflux transporter RhtA
MQGTVGLIIFYVLAAVKLFAFVSSLLFESEAYRAAGKLTKPTWTIILGVAFALQVFPLFGGLINLALTIAAFVYLADVRPALSSLKRR